MKQLVGLNTLRFIGFLAIFISHTTSFYEHGFQVVSYFFVLSSFLLFYLALSEIERTGSFSKIHFFIRRSLRIFPLYFLALLIGLIIVPVVANYFHHEIKPVQHPFYYVFFLSNYDFSDHLFALKFLWSIAVEEQFYLLFLILSPWFFRYSWGVISLLIIGYIVYVVLAYQNNWRLFTQLPFHLINFAAGMTAAWFFKKKNVSTRLLLIFFLLFVAISIVFSGKEVFFNTSSSFAFAALILMTIRLSEKRILTRFFVFSALEKLGSYSYGMYVYSGFVITFGTFFIQTGNLFFNAFIELFITIIISIVSYHFFESYFLRLKHKFSDTKKG